MNKVRVLDISACTKTRCIFWCQSLYFNSLFARLFYKLKSPSTPRPDPMLQ